MTSAFGAGRTMLALQGEPWSVTSLGMPDTVLAERALVQLLEQTVHASQPVSISDLERLGLGQGAWLGLPLRTGRRRFGVIALEAATPFAFDEGLFGHLTLLAEHVTLKLDALERSETQERERQARLRQLEQAALEDALTGLRNRRAFDEDIAKLVTLAQRHGHAFAVGMIDLDGLKRINDRDGHERGNTLLRTFAQTLSHNLRRGDTLYRLGGDEFALVLPEFDMQAAQRLQALLDEVMHQVRAEYPQVGASFGLAHHAEAATTTELLELADKRMYRQKAARRNGTPALNR